MLSGSESLRVISATSVRQYRGTTRTVNEIARELGVSHVLEGVVQSSGDRIRVNAQLIEVASDSHLWARAYERALSVGNLFAIQAEIAGDIASALETVIGVPAREADRLPTRSLPAYESLIRARTLLASREPESMRQAVEDFEAAIAEDGNFADAWAGLAEALSLLAYYGFAEPGSVLPRARAAANRALELDPEQACARATLGVIELQRTHDAPAALDYLRRAHGIDPRWSRGWLGWVEAIAGDLESGLQRLEIEL